MLDALDSFFEKLATVGLCLVAVVFITAEPAMEFLKGFKRISESVSENKEAIESLQSDISGLSNLIEDSSGVKVMDASEHLNDIDSRVSNIEERNKEVLEILRDDPDTLATIREVNVKYDHILQGLDKIEGDVDRTEDKLFSALQSRISVWWGLAFVMLGWLGPKVLHRLFPRQDS